MPLLSGKRPIEITVTQPLISIVCVNRRKARCERRPPAGSAAMPVRTPWLVIHRDMRSVKQIRIIKSWIVRAFEVASREQVT